ncbi:MAG: SIR2 family protein, partial [Rubrivivax sp.]|nr:SIR2 family protein [Rubrivivax sp.]
MALPHYSFNDLVQSLEGRRRLGEDPPVLLLGSGSSAAAGVATMSRLYEAEGIDPTKGEEAFGLFCERMDRRDDRERFRWLAGLLQTADPDAVTPGYRALARLCAEHVFDIVLSANLDPLLEDAFSATALKRRDVLILVNGVLRPDRLPTLLLPGVPRVKLLKIHGDLFHRAMAWTPTEMQDYLKAITPTLSAALNGRDVLVVGYSMRDPAVRDLALATGGTVWFAGPDAPPAEVAALLEPRQVRLVLGPRCQFEAFFTQLAQSLGVDAAAPQAPAAAAAP